MRCVLVLALAISAIAATPAAAFEIEDLIPSNPFASDDGPVKSDLEADLAELDGEITETEATVATYRSDRNRALGAGRLEVLKLTRAMLQQRLVAVETETQFEVRAPVVYADKERSERIIEELKNAEAERKRLKREADKAPSGALGAMWLSALAIQEQTVAMLRQEYFVARYGLSAPAMTKLPAQSKIGAVIEVPTRSVGSGGQAKPAKLSKSEIRAVQQTLASIGYDIGKVDGSWGPRSRHALTQYQCDADLELTGVLDQATAATLAAP
jgi:hypothetical protein